MTLNCWKFKGEKSKRWGSLRHRRRFFHRGIAHDCPLAHIDPMRADSDHLFELRVYQWQEQRIRIVAGPSKQSHFPFSN